MLFLVTVIIIITIKETLYKIYFRIINFTMCCCLFQLTVMSSFPRLYRFVVWMTITMSQTLNGKKSWFFLLFWQRDGSDYEYCEGSVTNLSSQLNSLCSWTERGEIWFSNINWSNQQDIKLTQRLLINKACQNFYSYCKKWSHCKKR